MGAYPPFSTFFSFLEAQKRKRILHPGVDCKYYIHLVPVASFLFSESPLHPPGLLTFTIYYLRMASSHLCMNAKQVHTMTQVSRKNMQVPKIKVSNITGKKRGCLIDLTQELSTPAMLEREYFCFSQSACTVMESASAPPSIKRQKKKQGK